MEHYTKASSHAAEGDEKKEVYDIHVKSGSKIKNIISQAYRLLKNKQEEKIVLTGSGPTVTKTITCAEIIKRKSKGLHQLNKLFYTKIQDTWEPKEESLDKLQVTRKVPSITITLSKVPLDAALPGYQAPGKSKSPVQFGDEDWELAWDESRDDSMKTTQKTHLEQNATAKRKLKRFVAKGNAEIKTGSQETPNKHVNAHSEKDADPGQLQDNICENLEGHLESENLGTEHRQAGSLQGGDLQSKQLQRLEATALEDNQSCEGFLGGSVFEGRQSQEVHQKGSVQEHHNNGCQEGAGCTLGRGQNCLGNEKVDASQAIHMSHVQGGTRDGEEHLDLGELKIQQLQEHLKVGVTESQKSDDRCLTYDTSVSTGIHGGYIGEVVESEQGYSNGSQWTEGAHKRPSNNGSPKTKPSPTKKQKAEEF